jgi:hypothetical protein
MKNNRIIDTEDGQNNLLINEANNLKDTWLEPWEELVGVLEEIEDDGERLQITVSNESLNYPSDSPIANDLKGELCGSEGQSVKILRTDIKNKQVVVDVSDPGR